MKKKIIVTAIILCYCAVFFVVYVGLNSDKPNNAVNVASTEKAPVIIIDAGHGAFDGGAVTKDGYPEKDINLSIALHLNEYLNLMGFDTILTRDSDESLEDEGLNTIRKKKKSDLYNRMEIMEKTENAVFISIHQNSYPVEKYSGMQVFYSQNFSEISSALAKSIQENTVSLLQPNNQRQTKPCGTSVFLIYNAKKPACLVECGFLSNNEEAEKLKTPQYQKQIAFCIATGVQEFYNNKD